MNRPHLLIVALIAVGLSSACGGCKEDDPDTEPGVCERNPEAVADAPECFTDDNCPCGSYCRVGVCAADCTSDDECSEEGESCNLSGLCVPEGQPEWGRPLQLEPVGTLTVDEKTLAFPTVGSDRVVLIRSRDGALAPFRAVVSDGYGIRCNAGEDWVSECTFDELDTDENGPTTVFIRSFEESVTAPGAVGELRVYAGRQLERVGLNGVSTNFEPSPQALFEANRGTGVYEGSATLVRAGLALDDQKLVNQAPGARPPFEVLAITAVVSSADGRSDGFIRLSDDSETLFDRAGTTASLVADSGGFSRIVMPARAWPGDNPDTGLWIEPSTEDPQVTVERNSGNVENLSFDLPMLVHGATTADAAIELTWRVVLRRAGDCVPENCTLPTSADPPLNRTEDVRPTADAEFAYEAFLDAFARQQDCPDTGTATECAAWTTWVENLVCSSIDETSRLANRESTMSATGDLGCEEPNGGAPLPMPTVGLYDPTLAWDPTKLEICLNDLSGGEGAERLCVETDRVVSAVTQALEADRYRGLKKAPASSNNVEEFKQTALGHRLLQQLLGVCSFVANQANSSELAPIDPAIASVVEDPVRAASVCGLIGDLIVHPRIAVPLSVARRELLAEPDYRARLFPVDSFSDGPQQSGLPVALATFVERQSNLLAGVVRELRNGRVPPLENTDASEARVMDEVRRATRRHLVMIALANSMYDRAAASCAPEDCVWKRDWDIARDAAALAFSGVSAELGRYRSDENELRITERDLPLYRVGDEVSASERFYAVSDYLLGEPNSAAPGVAEDLVDDALDALSDAQRAYQDNLQNKVVTELSRQDQVRRLNEISVKYGERIAALCGDPDMVAATILGPDDPFDEDPDCWVKSQCQCDLITDEDGNRSCAGGKTGTLTAVGDDRRSKAAIGEKLCTLYQRISARPDDQERSEIETRIEEMDAVFGNEVLGGGGPFEFVYNPGAFGFEVRYLEDASFGSSAEVVTNRFSYSELDRLSAPYGPRPDPSCKNAADATRATIAAVALGTLTNRNGEPVDCREDAEDGVLCPCGERVRGDEVNDCPPGFGCDLTRPNQGFAGTCVESEPRRSAADRNDCFQGEIGEAALLVDSAKLDIDIARARMDELYELFKNSTRSCIIQKAGSDAQAALLEQHNATLDALEEEKAVWDSVAAVGNTVTEVLANDNPKTSGLAALGGVVGLAGELGGIETERQIASSQREYEAMAAALAAETDLDVCLNEASAIMIGLKSMSLELDGAVTDLAQAYAEFVNLQTELGAAWLEGADQLARENSLRRPVLDFDFWLDDKIETFTRTMRGARRAAFLAVIAVEYEFQASTGEQLSVLAARHPDDLRAVLERLRTLSQTGQIAGSSPNNGVVVVSLAEDVQHLGTASVANVSRCDRFRNQLSAATRNGVQGQVIEFELSATPLSNSSDEFELFGPLSCAERLWSVNASIISKDNADLVSGADPTGKAQVFLRKQNSFNSRWCEDVADRSDLQQAAFRPGVNLFDDALSPASSDFGNGSIGDGYSTATVDARFDLTRVELEDEAYFNGDSQELAGRGLYGKYELFLPNQIFASSSGEGVNHEAICDVLLRFDYVSATRN